MTYAPDPVILPGGGYGGRVPIPEHVKVAIVALAETGEMSVRQIAERVNVSHASVARIAHAAGVVFDSSRTREATRSLLDRLRARRAERLEEAERAVAQARALAEQQMLDNPTDQRGRAEALKAYRDSVAAYADLAKIVDTNDMDVISDYLAASDLVIIQSGEWDEEKRSEGRAEVLDALKAEGVAIPADLAEKLEQALARHPEPAEIEAPGVGDPPSEVEESRGHEISTRNGARVQNTQVGPDQAHQDKPHAGEPVKLGRTRQDPEQ